jgi:hypothetical protein
VEGPRINAPESNASATTATAQSGPSVNFRGQRRSYAMHLLTTDPDARLEKGVTSERCP